jgi:hypothetical protein
VGTVSVIIPSLPKKTNGSRDSLFGMRQIIISAYTKFLMEFISKKHRPSIKVVFYHSFMLATGMGFLEKITRQLK